MSLLAAQLTADAALTLRFPGNKRPNIKLITLKAEIIGEKQESSHGEHILFQGSPGTLLLYQQPKKPLGHKTLSFRWSLLIRLVKSVGQSSAPGEASPPRAPGKDADQRNKFPGPKIKPLDTLML